MVLLCCSAVVLYCANICCVVLWFCYVRLECAVLCRVVMCFVVSCWNIYIYIIRVMFIFIVCSMQATRNYYI